MNEKTEQTDWSTWFSTYGILTSERILARFDIHLPHDELIRAVNDPNSVYFHLLHVPLKNVFNGIVFQQAHDYQVYAQKLLVDYLLSGEDVKDNSAPGAETRDEVEKSRLRLTEAGEEFRKVEEAHQILIAESQGKLVELSRDLGLLKRDPSLLADSMSSYVERAEENNINLRHYRSEFYHLILRITELLYLMTDYHLDQEKVAKNREALEFNALI